MYFNNENQLFWKIVLAKSDCIRSQKTPKSLEPLWPLLEAVFQNPASYCTLGIR